MSITCYKCGQQIDHDTIYSALAIECPTCGIKLHFEGPAAAHILASTRTDEEDYTFKNSYAGICRLVLRSGTTLDISDIVLYPQHLVLSTRQNVAEAEKLSSGFSTGLGFWGSPQWAIGGALLLGALESAIGGKMQASGNEILKKAVETKDQLLREGEAFPVQNIFNVDRIDPRQWMAGYTQYGIHEGVDGVLKRKKTYKLDAVTRFYIHHGEPFVEVVATNGRKIKILWENVEQYEILTDTPNNSP